MKRLFAILAFVMIIALLPSKTDAFIQNDDIKNCVNEQCTLQIRSDKVYWNINYIERDKDIVIEIKNIIGNDTISFSIINNKNDKIPFSVGTILNDLKQVSLLNKGITEFEYKGIININKLIFKFGNNSTLMTLNYTSNSEDAYIRQNLPDNNYGTATNLDVYGTTSSLHRAVFTKFDISSIPVGINITDAQLCLFPNNVAENGLLLAYHVYIKDWRQSLITWNNNPCGNGDTNTSWNINNCNQTYENKSVMVANQYSCFDITTSAIKDYFNASGNLSVVITMSANNDNNVVNFRSKEYATTTQRPYLNITYGEPPPIQYGNVTFNVKDNETDLHISNLTISCNNSYVANFSSPLTHEFQYGDYNCSFAHISYYSNQSIFTINSNSSQINLTMGEIIYPKNITFIILDSFTNDDILSILLIGINAGKPSDNFSVTEDSPFNHSFMNKTIFDCDVSKNGYENFSFSINISEITSVTVLLDRIGGLTSSEKQKLDQVYFLQSVAALPEELIIQNQSCIDEDTLATSYNPVYCSIPANCNDVLTFCTYGCDRITGSCRGNPIETGALFIGFIIYMAATIIVPIMILTHHSNKKKRDMIIGFFTFFFMLVVYLITTAYMIPSIAIFFGNDYYVTTILVGLTIIFFPLINLILIINNMLKDRY